MGYLASFIDYQLLIYNNHKVIEYKRIIAKRGFLLWFTFLH